MVQTTSFPEVILISMDNVPLSDNLDAIGFFIPVHLDSINGSPYLRWPIPRNYRLEHMDDGGHLIFFHTMNTILFNESHKGNKENKGLNCNIPQPFLDLFLDLSFPRLRAKRFLLVCLIYLHISNIYVFSDFVICCLMVSDMNYGPWHM